MSLFGKVLLRLFSFGFCTRAFFLVLICVSIPFTCSSVLVFLFFSFHMLILHYNCLLLHTYYAFVLVLPTSIIFIFVRLSSTLWVPRQSHNIHVATSLHKSFWCKHRISQWQCISLNYLVSHRIPQCISLTCLVSQQPHNIQVTSSNHSFRIDDHVFVILFSGAEFCLIIVILFDLHHMVVSRTFVGFMDCLALCFAHGIIKFFYN